MKKERKVPAAVALGRRSGIHMTKTERIERAKRAARARWAAKKGGK